MLWAGQAGGRGQCKDLGRLLLERKVERQSCQRAAVNSLFQVDNPNKYYSSEAMEEGCSDTCELEKMCVCTMCKCCSNCANKCRCSYANVGFDESLAQHLLPSTSVIYQTVKEETEGWIALEDDDDEGEEDEETGDKTCCWVENVAKLFSLSGMKTIEHFNFWKHELARKIIYLESAEVSQT